MHEKGEDYFGDLQVYGRLILKCIFRNIVLGCGLDLFG
jgi:hypothetical protein